MFYTVLYFRLMNNVHNWKNWLIMHEILVMNNFLNIWKNFLISKALSDKTVEDFILKES
jgi:hypothetical protein